jgi:tetratricopeptide (TPR) repeat protein
VVLEYDQHQAAAATPPPTPGGVDPALITRAREAYLRGNSDLFHGRSGEAIAAYRSSLSIYPGYVAGYRGLGLAYAEAGNKAEAIKNLELYLSTVPYAHDSPVITRRIDRLKKGH